MTNRVSRLAPSPTGALHLGNARTFLINWAIARQQGWTLPLRIEDLDGPRIKPHATEAAIAMLRWLGLDDDGLSVQSDDLTPHHAAMKQLCVASRVFPCRLTRRDIERASSAPHAGDHETAFPRHLRPEIDAIVFDDDAVNYRFVVPDEKIEFHDEIAGPQRFSPAREVGDFVVWTKRRTPAYQLAVVVDDAGQGVTDVVRGADLLSSTARQILLHRALGTTPPRWWHLPLVLGPDGRRLAKRHGDTRVDRYRLAGVAPERVIGLLAAWSGVLDRPAEMSAADFRDRFDVASLPPDPIVFTSEDDAWLLASSPPSAPRLQEPRP
ncbi:MAG: tRNA glutamyl-Q(34) synthetase GluQRS [Phycisphaerales bacterium]|nr:tRNA glutamyl-Q(34) synthetase GluQRS [Phycisphaerales bacterium]